MLEQVSSSDLCVYATWVPVLIPDVEVSVPSATRRLSDPRVSHFWDEDGKVIKAGADLLQLGDKPAWDVYFVFDRHARWGEQLPVPAYWMHQLDLDPQRKLDGDRLRHEVVRLLQDDSQASRRNVTAEASR